MAAQVLLPVKERTAGQEIYPAFPVANPKALAFWCWDPRFQMAVLQFLQAELNLKPGEYIPLTIAGGIASLSVQLERPKEFRYVREACEFYLNHFRSVERVILVNHEDCGKYKKLAEILGHASFLRGFADLAAREIHDLERHSALVASFAPHPVKVER